MATPAQPLLFDFEIPASQDLTFIPLGVRYNLDCCGARISLEDWQRLPHAVRVELACVPPEGGAAAPRGRFATLLDAAMRAHVHAAPERFEPDAHPPWLDAAAVPPQLALQCELAGLEPVTQPAWAALGLPQRYALVKLSRKPARNHDFPHAMAEFGLAPAAS
jgi:hypothetical protein